MLLRVTQMWQHAGPTQWLTHTAKYTVAQNRQTAISRQPIEFFLPKYHDLQGGARLSTVFENFTEIFSLLQKLQLLQYSIPYFQCLLPYGQFLVDHFVVF